MFFFRNAILNIGKYNLPSRKYINIQEYNFLKKILYGSNNTNLNDNHYHQLKQLFKQNLDRKRLNKPYYFPSFTLENYNNLKMALNQKKNVNQAAINFMVSNDVKIDFVHEDIAYYYYQLLKKNIAVNNELYLPKKEKHENIGCLYAYEPSKFMDLLFQFSHPNVNNLSWKIMPFDEAVTLSIVDKNDKHLSYFEVEFLRCDLKTLNCFLKEKKDILRNCFTIYDPVKIKITRPNDKESDHSMIEKYYECSFLDLFVLNYLKKRRDIKHEDEDFIKMLYKMNELSIETMKYRLKKEIKHHKGTTNVLSDQKKRIARLNDIFEYLEKEQEMTNDFYANSQFKMTLDSIDSHIKVKLDEFNDLHDVLFQLSIKSNDDFYCQLADTLFKLENKKRSYWKRLKNMNMIKYKYIHTKYIYYPLAIISTPYLLMGYGFGMVGIMKWIIHM